LRPDEALRTRVTMTHDPAGTAFHAVQFYEHPEALCAATSEFIAEGIEAGNPALVIARPAHRAAILDGLRQRGIDPVLLQAKGDLLILDARDTLATLMANGQPNGALLDEQAARLFERMCRARSDCTIWAYGEMVDLLWESGNQVGAIVMEILW